MEMVKYDKVIGLDVHQGVIVCCAIWTEKNALRVEKNSFKTFRNDLRQMATWCASHSPDLVLMESTGIYWKSPYAHLEKVGIKAAVVNARQVKQMEGKKTDIGDAEWLAHVGRLAVFNRSFIPSKQYQDLRVPSRYLLKLRNQLSSEKNRLAKVLADAGFRLNLVFSRLGGVNAQRVIDGLMTGKRPEEIMASLDVKRLKASEKDLRSALDGELSDEHLFTLKEITAHIHYLECESERLQRHLTEKVIGLHEHALMLLQTIPGIDEQSAVQIIIELGGDDLSSFRTASHLASWVGVCPGNNESAGKRKHGHIRKGNCYLRRILCECANAAVRSKGTTLQSKYQSLRIRKGTKRSLIAIVHKIVRLIYIVFEKKEGYRDPKIDYDEQNVLKNGKRWMQKLIACGKWQINAIDRETGECFQSA